MSVGRFQHGSLIVSGLFLLLILGYGSTSVFGSTGEQGGTGRIEGVVRDEATREPLGGASITLGKMDRATIADSVGRFLFENVATGDCKITITYLGYRKETREKVCVRDGETTRLEIDMVVRPIPGRDIRVVGERRLQSTRGGTGTVVVNGTAIETHPGGIGDVSRVLSGMVYVARFDDRYPSLVVRGGSPIENGFYIDNIPVPNINHFPSQGSGSGPLGVLNASMIEHAAFYAGGFPVSYGNRLSSVFDISLRDGRGDGLSGRATIDIAGASVQAEGPLPNQNGSFLVSGRRGFLNLLMDALDIDAAPNYGDLHAKVSVEVDSGATLEFLGIVGRGDLTVSEDASHSVGTGLYGTLKYDNMTVGANLEMHRAGGRVSSTSLSYNRSTWSDELPLSTTNSLAYQSNSSDEHLTIRSKHRALVTSRLALRYGGEIGLTGFDYAYTTYSFNDGDGYLGETVSVDEDQSYPEIASWLSAAWRIWSWLEIEAGVRWDYSDFTTVHHFSPRGSISLEPDDATTIRFSAGKYYQALPLVLALQHESNRELYDPRVLHLTLGVSRDIGQNLTADVEMYSKTYEYMPMDELQPTVFVLDELVYNYGYIAGHGPLTATGEAWVRGIEADIGYSPNAPVQVTIGASYTRARYRDYNGDWRNRVIDNRVAMDISSRYQPSAGWMVVARWVYGGGRPYTPYDLVESSRWNSAVFDHDRANEVRFPAYHSLSMRVQRKIRFSGSHLILYGEVWNAYDRENVSLQYWDEDTNGAEQLYQIPRLPVIGIEYRF